MKRQELIKHELNPPCTRLCKDEIKTISKLFGDDLSKQLKDMAELKRAGIQMQKSSSTSTSSEGSTAPKQRFNRPHFAKPYARAHGRFATQKTNCQRHFLAHSRAPRGADFLSQLVLNFKASCVKDWKSDWKSDTYSVILDAIQHHPIEFVGSCRPAQATKPKQIIFFIWGQRNHKP